MAALTRTFILFTFYLLQFGNCIYLQGGQYFVPNGGNQLSGSAGGDVFPSASSTIQTSPRDASYYVPRNPQPYYRKGITRPGAGSLPFPNKYAVNPSASGVMFPSITVNSVNNAVSTSSSQPSSNQLAELDSGLDDF